MNKKNDKSYMIIQDHRFGDQCDPIFMEYTST